jgi:hypothetical protein
MPLMLTPPTPSCHFFRRFFRYASFSFAFLFDFLPLHFAIADAFRCQIAAVFDYAALILLFLCCFYISIIAERHKIFSLIFLLSAGWLLFSRLLAMPLMLAPLRHYFLLFAIFGHAAMPLLFAFRYCHTPFRYFAATPCHIYYYFAQIFPPLRCAICAAAIDAMASRRFRLSPYFTSPYFFDYFRPP